VILRTVSPTLLVLVTLLACAKANADAPAGPEHLLPFPPDFRATDLACADDWVVVFGYSSPFASAVTTATVLRAARSSSGWETSYSGQSRTLMRNAGLAEDGSLFAVVRAGNGGGQPLLIWSTNTGRTWASGLPLPKHAFGATFADRSTGYAWSSTHVYRTVNGGRNWSEMPVAGVFAEGRPDPVIGSRGELWAIMRIPQTGPPVATVVCLSPELGVEQRLEIHDRVSAIAVVEGGLRLFGQQNGHGNAQLAHVAHRGADLSYRIVAELGKDLPIDYASSGNSAAAILSDTSNLGSNRYLLLSADTGRSWTRAETEHDSPQAVCVGSGMTWIAGQKRIWYLP